MLDHVESVFDNMQSILKQLKKASYAERMEQFRNLYGHYFRQMTEAADCAVLLAVHRKFDRTGLVSLGPIYSVARVVTDREPLAERKTRFEEQELRFITTTEEERLWQMQS